MNQMRSAFRSLKNLQCVVDDPEKATKLDQILSNVDVDDLLMAVELFKETAEEDDVNATNMTGYYGPAILDNSANMSGHLIAPTALKPLTMPTSQQ
jgi:hypothetical protein